MNEKYRVVDIVNKHGGIANKRSNTGQTDFEMWKFMTSQNIQDQCFQVVLMWKLLLQRITLTMFNPDMIRNIVRNTNNYARWKMDQKGICPHEIKT